ncbi:hypothetical protein VCHENC02_5723B, partial [Vibrio harveyi]
EMQYVSFKAKGGTFYIIAANAYCPSHLCI